MSKDADKKKGLAAVLERLNALEGKFVTAEDFKKQLDEYEGKILQKIPAMTRAQIHGGAEGVDGQKLNAQLSFMCRNNPKRNFDEAEAKALGIEIGAGGGFLVPEEFMAEVNRKKIKRSVIRPLAKTFSGVSTKGSMPKEGGTVKVIWESENIKTPETQNPVFQSTTWALNKMKGLIKVSDELVSGSGIDMFALLSDMFGEAFEVEEDLVFMNGSGSLRPLGIRNTPGIVAVPQAGADLDYDDFINIKHGLKVQYRNDAVWLLPNTVLETAAKIRDGQGRPIFIDIAELGNAGAPMPPMTIGRFLGRPAFEQNDIPTDLDPGGNKSEIWFGDLGQYFVFDGGTMEMSTSTDLFFDEDATAVKMLQFLDGKIGQEEAFKFGSGIK